MTDYQPVTWDNCLRDSLSRGHLRAIFTDLGAASGSLTTGLKRIVVEPGAQSSPVHVHGAEEEIFFVLGGSGLSWQDGETFEVGPGDCLAQLPGGGAADAIAHVAGGEAHTLVAGSEGLDVLAYGARMPDEACYLPRSHVAWLGASWATAGDSVDPYDREAAAGPIRLPRPSPRPSRIVNVGRLAGELTHSAGVRRLRRDVGRAVGSIRLGLQHVTVEPFGLSSLPHCHACEEELFIVLAGDGSCLLGPDEYPVQRGSVLARPAGTGRRTPRCRRERACAARFRRAQGRRLRLLPTLGGDLLQGRQSRRPGSSRWTCGQSSGSARSEVVGRIGGAPTAHGGGSNPRGTVAHGSNPPSKPRLAAR